MLLLGSGSIIDRTGLGVGRGRVPMLSHISGGSNHGKKELFIKIGGKMGDRVQMQF